jgi:precorrin-6y C5,15-methyltransferase (decarboxylating) CbiE subunit
MATRITIVGCGPGSIDYLTPAALHAIRTAEVLVGADRLLRLFPESAAERIPLSPRTEETLDRIEELVSTKSVAVLVTGDPGLYSLSRQVIRRFGRDCCKLIPGVSSVQTAFARIGLDWENALVLSAHKESPGGERMNLAREFDSIAVLTGRKESAAWIAEMIQDLADDRRVFICEDLTLPDERVREVSREELAGLEIRSRAVVIIVKASLMA